MTNGVASWLFVKEARTTWVERPSPHSLTIAGPGNKRERREFGDESSLEAYFVALAEHLIAEGWILSQVNYDRRSSPRRHNAPIVSDRRND